MKVSFKPNALSWGCVDSFFDDCHFDDAFKKALFYSYSEYFMKKNYSFSVLLSGIFSKFHIQFGCTLSPDDYHFLSIILFESHDNTSIYSVSFSEEYFTKKDFEMLFTELLCVIKNNIKNTLDVSHKSPDKIFYRGTKYGFKYGSAEISRECSDDKKGWVALRLTTGKVDLDIYVTKNGSVRVFEVATKKEVYTCKKKVVGSK